MRKFIAWLSITAGFVIIFVGFFKLFFSVIDYISIHKNEVIYWITQHPGTAVSYFVVIAFCGWFASIVVYGDSDGKSNDRK